MASTSSLGPWRPAAFQRDAQIAKVAQHRELHSGAALDMAAIGQELARQGAGELLQPGGQQPVMTQRQRPQDQAFHPGEQRLAGQAARHGMGEVARLALHRLAETKLEGRIAAGGQEHGLGEPGREPPADDVGAPGQGLPALVLGEPALEEGERHGGGRGAERHQIGQPVEAVEGDAPGLPGADGPPQGHGLADRLLREMEAAGRDLAPAGGIGGPGIDGNRPQAGLAPPEQQTIIEGTGEDRPLGAVEDPAPQHAGGQIEQAAIAPPPGALHRTAGSARHASGGRGSWLAQAPDVLGIGGRPAGEGRRAGDEHIGPGGHRPGRGLGIDAAVDLEIDGPAGAVDAPAELGDLVELGGDEALAAEAGIDAHHQHQIDVIPEMVQHGDRRRRIERDPCLLAQSLTSWRERWRCGPASAWMVMISAPASAKAGI